MKKIIIFTLILLSLVILGRTLKVNVPVQVSYLSNNLLSLNDKEYKFALPTKKAFNSISLRLLSYNKPLNGTIDIKVINSKTGKILVRHSLKTAISHGDFYNFNTLRVKPSKNYYLVIKGSPGVTYNIVYNSLGTDLLAMSNGVMTGSPVYKLSDEISILKAAFTASERAANDWFRLGKLYPLAIIVYLLGALLLVTFVLDRRII